jgi:hypothetical protein
MATVRDFTTSAGVKTREVGERRGGGFKNKRNRKEMWLRPLP